jgi:hypothetical protein
MAGACARVGHLAKSVISALALLDFKASQKGQFLSVKLFVCACWRMVPMMHEFAIETEGFIKEKILTRCETDDFK